MCAHTYIYTQATESVGGIQKFIELEAMKKAEQVF